MAWGNALVLTVRDLPELYRYGMSMNKLFPLPRQRPMWWNGLPRGSELDCRRSGSPCAMNRGMVKCGDSAGRETERQPARRIASGNADAGTNRFDYAHWLRLGPSALQPLSSTSRTRWPDSDAGGQDLSRWYQPRPRARYPPSQCFNLRVEFWKSLDRPDRLVDDEFVLRSTQPQLLDHRTVGLPLKTGASVGARSRSIASSRVN